MSTINKIGVKITGDESSLKKATQNAKKDIKSVSQTALSVGDIIKGSALGSIIADTLTSAFRAVTNEIGNAITRLDTLSNYSNVMAGLGVSAEDSETSINLLNQALQGLPTNITDATNAVKRMTATNGNIQASTEMVIALNNALLASGSSAEQQASALEQIQQAYAKGKPEMQDWKTMLQTMPAQLKQVAQAMGYVSSSQLYDALQAGTVNMNDFMNAVLKLNNEGMDGFASFAEQAKNASQGIGTAMTTLKYSVQNALSSIMQEIGRSDISSFINGIASAVSTATQYVVAFVRIIKEAVAWVSALFGWGSKGDTSNIVAVSEATESAGAGAQATADGLADANNQAKALKKNLAGFDEMNVLKEDTSSSSGSTGSTGSAGTAIADYSWDTSALDQVGDKIDEIVQKIKNGFKEIFGEWDFTKLAKSVKSFVEKSKGFLQTLGKIAGDIWKNYIAPFLEWAGTSLLPAFFDALGGALELLGNIIGTLWDNWLEPFITNFLKPIAEFTGGVIVSVLTALGDALSWIAEQSVVVNFITDFAVALGVAAAAVFSFNAVATILNGVLGALGVETLAVKGLLVETTVAQAGMTAGTTALTGATTLFSGAVGVLNGVLTFLTSTAGVVTLAIGALVAIFETVRVANEMAEFAASHYKSQQDLLAEATNRAASASRNQLAALQDIETAQLAASDEELRLLTLTEDATTKREKYAKMLDSGTYSQSELTKAQLEAEIAEGKLQAQMKTLSEAITKAADAQDDYHEAVMMEIAATLEAEQRQKAMKGDYESIYEALVDLTTGTHTFALQSGESYTLTAEEADAMAANILDALDESGSGFSSWLDETEKYGHRIREVFHSIRESAFETWSNMEPAGNNFDNGVARGILSNKWVVENAARELANAGKMAYEKALQIKSPSRVMAKDGGYFAQGIAKGIEGQVPALKQTVSNVGVAMVEAFNKAPKFADLGTAGIAKEFDDLTAKAQANLTLQNDQESATIDKLAEAIMNLADKDTQVTVKIGEETLVERMIDGINNASTMRNRTVIQL